MNLEITPHEETQDEEDISSALAACYLLARQRATTVWIQARPNPQEPNEETRTEHKKDQHRDD